MSCPISSGAGRSRTNLAAMSKALVLNVTHEPLSVVPARRAVVLVLGGKAAPMHASPDVIRSEQLVVEVPSVVRLHYFVHVPFQHAGSISRRGVFARDRWTCQYCGDRADSIDHVRPRSRGGEHTWDNVVAACRPCNAKKRDRLVDEAGMKLRRRPSVPSRARLLAHGANRVPSHWLPYLEPLEHAAG